MSLTIQEVDHIAQLARLELTTEERERFRDQLSAILDYFTQLQELDTHDIPPTSSVLPPQAGLRKDRPRLGLSPEDLLENAPAARGDQFLVPPVLE
jgi:aspartyl-tRNA(Asn)/glutamyl-tRNA(Gln) amidotransferase subunit C